MMIPPNVVSNVLPRAVVLQLVAASRVDPGVPAGESVARAREIDAVTFRARLHYPHLFRSKF